MMGTWLPETCREVEINILRSSVHLVGNLQNLTTVLLVTALETR